jgi:hypothetical protein
MKKNITTLFVLILLLMNANDVYSQFDYSDFDSLLQKIVRGNSVNYSQLLEEKEDLITITSKMSEFSPNSHPENFKSENEQLAYWINAYNAFILKIIMENYPVESIKDINFIGFTIWLNKNLIGGEEISFKSLEDDIIRDRFKDPRIHFAINCASFSCPPLKDRAYYPEILDKQMNESTISFINDKNNFWIDEDESIIYLSSIFDWYENDFINWLNKNKNIEEPHLLDYIKLYYDGEIKEKLYELDIEFIEYNWQLNDIPRI